MFQSLKNNALDSHIEELRKELYDREDENQEAYKNLLAAEGNVLNTCLKLSYFFIIYNKIQRFLVSYT